MEKYSFTKNTSASPLRPYNDLELDPYSPAIVEDLLQGVNEWRNIQDIIRLTFKALTDVVKAQGETIRELERAMPTRASKVELNTGLSLKANINDVSRTVNEVAASLDSKLSFEDIQSILKDYPIKADLQYLLSQKVGLEDFRGVLDQKASIHEYKSDIATLSTRLEETQRDLFKKIGSLASQRDLQQVQEGLDQKANLTEVTEALDTKANKQSVSNALHRKANRADIDSLLTKKAEITDLQSVLQVLDSKADVRTIEKLTEILDLKVDRQEIPLYFSRLEESSNNLRKEMEEFEKEVFSFRNDSEHREAKREEAFKHEIEALKEQLAGFGAKKGEQQRDLERVLSQKLDFEQMNEGLTTMKNEIYEDLVILKNEINMQRNSVEDVLNERFRRNDIQHEEELARLTERIKSLMEDRQNDMEETAKYVKQLTAIARKELERDLLKLLEDFEGLRRTCEELLGKKIDKKEFLEFKGKLLQELEGKPDLSEVQTALNSSQSDISTRFIEYKDEIKALLRSLENELFGLMSKKASLSDVNAALGTKIDAAALQNLLAQKLSVGEFEDVRKLVERLARELEDKPNTKDYEKLIGILQGQMNEVVKDLLLKANIKDVCTLLDTKSNIEDVNKALSEIHRELDAKSSLEDFNTYINDQAIINESLCSENIVGRWTWKSGELKGGASIPWESQVVNTLPDNFLWEKDKTSVLTVAAGLYELSFGFFAKKKPTVQLLVNGEAVLSAVNNASYVIHHSSGKIKDIKHPYGNITGLTMVDYIVLPARARLSFTYSGEVGGEGFFGLKRL